MQTPTYANFDQWKAALITELGSLLGEAPINDNPVKFGSLAVDFKAVDPQAPSKIELELHDHAVSDHPRLIARQPLDWSETDVAGLAHQIMHRAERRGSE